VIYANDCSIDTPSLPALATCFRRDNANWRLQHPGSMPYRLQKSGRKTATIGGGQQLPAPMTRALAMIGFRSKIGY
jgi:hypothetical protein